MKPPVALIAVSVLAVALGTTGCSRAKPPPIGRYVTSSPDARRVRDIYLHAAMYGTGHTHADVTKRVAQLLVEPGSQGFTPGVDWLRTDPVPNKNKTLLIHYTINGEQRLFTATGNQRVTYETLVAAATKEP